MDRRCNRTGADRIDAYAASHQLRRRSSGQRANGSLAGGIDAGSGGAGLVEKRRVEDDRGAVVQAGECFLYGQEDTLDVDVEYFVNSDSGESLIGATTPALANSTSIFPNDAAIFEKNASTSAAFATSERMARVSPPISS